MKVISCTRGGPASARGCNIAGDCIVTTNGRKSAEVIVPSREDGKDRTIKIFNKEERST